MDAISPSPSNNLPTANSSQPNSGQEGSALPFKDILQQHNKKPTSSSSSSIEQAAKKGDKQKAENKHKKPAEDDKTEQAQLAENAINQLNQQIDKRLNKIEDATLDSKLLAAQKSTADNLKALPSELQDAIAKGELAKTLNMLDANDGAPLVPFANEQDKNNLSRQRTLAQFAAQDDLIADKVISTKKPAIDGFILTKETPRVDEALLSPQQDDETQTEPTKKRLPDQPILTDKADPKDSRLAQSLQFAQTNAQSTPQPIVDNGAFTTQQQQPQPIPGLHTFTTTATVPIIEAAPIAPAAAPTPQLSGQLGSELWQQQLSQHVLMFVRNGSQQAQLKLHPEDLGTLNISLKIEDNQAIMHFVSPHSHVRAVMETAMPLLRSALQESGIQLTQSSVGQESADNQSFTNEQSSRGSNGSAQSLGGTNNIGPSMLTSASQSTSEIARSRGGVDIFA